MPDATATAAAVQDIPLDQIHASPYQPRKDFDEESIQALASSIEKEGLIQPITLRRSAYGYELISGERRLRAVKSLGKTSIEALVIDVPSEAAAVSKGLVENLQRRDLNPIEEAEGFDRLNKLDPGHWTHEEIAKVAGRSRVYITQSIGILGLPEEIKNDVCRQTLTRSHALDLTRLPDAESQLKAAKEINAKKLGRDEARRLVDKMLGKPEKPKEEKPAKEPQDGFRLVRKGDRLTISGSFPADASPDAIRESLNLALSKTVAGVPATGGMSAKSTTLA